MKSHPVAILTLAVFMPCSYQALAIDYVPIQDTNVVVTGVRATSSTTDAVVLTSSYVRSGTTYAGLYNGSLAAANTGTWTPLTPVIAGQTVTSATFYGPNTSLYTPSIGAGNVLAVGSYKYSESSLPAADHGLMYQGSVSGVGGTWTQIDATPLLSGGETLLNTIAHSNMGDLVVGNYDTSLTTGKAFIYNRTLDTWVNLNPNGSLSITAYGIWQTPGTSIYTIAGGFFKPADNNREHGYLLNYDSGTGDITDFKEFSYNNQPINALVTHFDGITATADGFNLTGDYILGTQEGAFFASVPINGDDSFGAASWMDIAYPGAEMTSGNTVVEDTVLGIFVNGGTQSYIAAVPEPSSCALALGVLVLGFGLVDKRQRTRGQTRTMLRSGL